jgi:hypothetical protein
MRAEIEATTIAKQMKARQEMMEVVVRAGQEEI